MTSGFKKIVLMASAAVLFSSSAYADAQTFHREMIDKMTADIHAADDHGKPMEEVEAERAEVVLDGSPMKKETVTTMTERADDASSIAFIEPAAGDAEMADEVEATVETTVTTVTTTVTPSEDTAEMEAMPNWSYIGADGAQNWGKISDKYVTCMAGTQQSPIDISQFMQESLPKLQIAYAQSPLMVANTGKTIQVNYEQGSKFKSGETIYDFRHIEFHTPSEHYIDGAPYPMEANFVHISPEGDLAIIAVMFKVGVQNAALQTLWDTIPQTGQMNAPEGVMFNASDLLPKDGTYFTYQGSITRPPCKEGVNWFVLQTPVELSREQLTGFQSLFPMNSRPLQPLNGRVIKGS